MPSKTKKQHNFMAAVAHGMKPRKGGPSGGVAREFMEADAASGSFPTKKKRGNGGPYGPPTT